MTTEKLLDYTIDINRYKTIYNISEMTEEHSQNKQRLTAVHYALLSGVYKQLYYRKNPAGGWDLGLTAGNITIECTGLTDQDAQYLGFETLDNM